jgi:tetratricopeptide (TPR) repeat protein
VKPDEAAVQYHRGRFLALEENLAQAEAAFKEALRLRPDYPTALAALRDVLVKQGKLAEAEASYRESIRARPDDASAHVQLGNFLLQQGKLADAETAFREAIRLKPDDRAARLGLGNVALLRKDPRPEDADSHYGRGLVLEQQGKRPEALAAFKEAVRQKPDWAAAHFKLGDLLRQEHKLGEAEAEYREAVRLKPDDVQAHYTLGYHLLNRGKPAEAEAELRETIRLQPDHAWAHRYLADALAQQGRRAEAVAEYRETVRLQPDDVWHHVTLGNYLGQQGNLAEAEAALLEAVRLQDKFDAAHQVLGNVYAREGKWDKAAAALARSLELTPGNSFAWMQRATLLLQVGDAEGYRRACRNMLERFAKTGQPRVAEQVARACLLLPDAVADGERLLKLVGVAAGGQRQGNIRSFLPVQALADYRAGRFDAAVKALGQFKPQAAGTGQDALAFAVLALAQHRLGRDREAGAALASAQAILAKKMPDFGKGQSFGPDWCDWLHGQLLCREAEELLKKAAEGEK